MDTRRTMPLYFCVMIMSLLSKNAILVGDSRPVITFSILKLVSEMVGGVESGKTWNGPTLTAIAAKNAIAAKKVLFAFFPMLNLSSICDYYIL